MIPGQQVGPGPQDGQGAQSTMMPILMFLAGAGFNEVAYAVDKLQRGITGLVGGGNASAPGGIPQLMGMLSGQPPAPPPPSPQQQLGPQPLQALAAMDLKRRMAELPNAMMGGQAPAQAGPAPAVGRFGGDPVAMQAFQRLMQAQGSTGGMA